jgi:hypothetical protein
MPPLSFDDEKISLLSNLASVLSPGQRSAFLLFLISSAPIRKRFAAPAVSHRNSAGAQKAFVRAGQIAVGPVGKYGRTQSKLRHAPRRTEKAR